MHHLRNFFHHAINLIKGNDNDTINDSLNQASHVASDSGHPHWSHFFRSFLWMFPQSHTHHNNDINAIPDSHGVYHAQTIQSHKISHTGLAIIRGLLISALTCFVLAFIVTLAFLAIHIAVIILIIIVIIVIILYII